MRLICPSNNRSIASLISIFFAHSARAEEEATSTPTKLTNQLFVKSAINTNNLSNTSPVLNGDDALGAATFVSVVRAIFDQLFFFH